MSLAILKHSDISYLQHHGILGMKWGVRKQKPQASNYSSKQRIYDRKIYGKRAEKRINDRMLKGEGLKSARHNEVVNKRRADIGKAIAKKVSGVAISVLFAYGVQKYGKNIAQKIINAADKTPVEDLIREAGPIIVKKTLG